MFEDLVRSGNMGRWWGAARRTKESFCSISTHSLHLLLRSFQLWFDLDWYELPPLLHIPNDDTSSSFGTMAPLYLVVYCRLCLKKWNNKNKLFFERSARLNLDPGRGDLGDGGDKWSDRRTDGRTDGRRQAYSGPRWLTDVLSPALQLPKNNRNKFCKHIFQNIKRLLIITFILLP